MSGHHLDLRHSQRHEFLIDKVSQIRKSQPPDGASAQSGAPEAKEKTRMTKKFRVLALATVLTLAFSALVASSATARPSTHKKGVTITIWDFFVNSPKERDALMTVANQWAK